MQRNVHYMRAAKFICGAAVLSLLTACAGNPYDETLDAPVPPVTAPATLPPAAASKPVAAGNKVALLLPMTGRASEAGQAMMNASQLAMFDLGADNLELIPEDTGPSAVAAARDALGKGAKIILGPLFASDARDVAPVAQASGANVISFSTDASVAGANTFILGFLPQSQVNRILEYAGGKGLTRIALIAPNDAFGNAVAADFETSLKQRGLSSGGILRYDGANPAPEKLSALMSSASPTAVLIAADIDASASIAQNTPAGIQKLGTGLWDQADGVKYPSLKGAWFAASSPALRRKFEKKIS